MKHIIPFILITSLISYSISELIGNFSPIEKGNEWIYLDEDINNSMVKNNHYNSTTQYVLKRKIVDLTTKGDSIFFDVEENRSLHKIISGYGNPQVNLIAFDTITDSVSVTKNFREYLEINNKYYYKIFYHAISDTIWKPDTLNYTAHFIEDSSVTLFDTAQEIFQYNISHSENQSSIMYSSSRSTSTTFLQNIGLYEYFYRYSSNSMMGPPGSSLQTSSLKLFSFNGEIVNAEVFDIATGINIKKPNPSISILNFQDAAHLIKSSPGSINIDLIDVTGRSVRYDVLNNIPVPVGVYVLVTRDNRKQERKYFKVLKYR